MIHQNYEDGCSTCLKFNVLVIKTGESIENDVQGRLRKSIPWKRWLNIVLGGKCTEEASRGGRDKTTFGFKKHQKFGDGKLMNKARKS
jgi:hypothetical protein